MMSLCRRLLLAAGIGILAAETGPAARLQMTADSAAPRLVLPVRRVPDAPPHRLPDLPAGALSLEPLTIETTVRRAAEGRAWVMRRTVARTVERVHITGSDGHEWLLQRNPRDPRRASGTLIDHSRRALVFHDESDLRNRLGLRGWADVLTLGFDPAVLSTLPRRAGSRWLERLQFARYMLPSGTEVWWNDELLLPARFTTGDGAAALQVAIARITPGVDSTLLRPATDRFPRYRTIDLAEWLEQPR